MMHTEREYRAEEAIRVLLTDHQRDMYRNSASFRAEVEQLVRFTIPTLLRGIEAQSEEHDKMRERMIEDLKVMLKPMPVILNGINL